MATNFSDLPYELRTQIFSLALQNPRVLHLIRVPPIPPKPLALYKSAFKTLSTLYRKGKKILPGKKTSKVAPTAHLTAADFTVSTSSYGKHHPALLSVNHESRNLALKTLKKYLGVYWDFEVDSAYFGGREWEDERELVLAKMYHARLLEPFRNIALDDVIYMWQGLTRGEDYRDEYAKYYIANPPSHMLNELPNLKNVTVTSTPSRFAPRDITIPYRSWSLGPGEVNGWIFGSPVKDNGFFSVGLYPYNDEAWFLREDVHVELGEICGRERENVQIGMVPWPYQ